MSCMYGYNDCANENKRCELCIKEINYSKIKIKNSSFKKKRKVKQTKRQGSIQEVRVYEQTKIAVEGTPNSGAGKIKGDLEISNMAMIECKTTTKKNINREPGKESFSIKKEWLIKLEREAKEAKKEFWYLAFSFKEYDERQFAICDINVINSMIATMKHDRETLSKNNSIIELHKRKFALLEAENTKLLAEIEYLKSKINVLQNERVAIK